MRDWLGVGGVGENGQVMAGLYDDDEVGVGAFADGKYRVGEHWGMGGIGVEFGELIIFEAVEGIAGGQQKKPRCAMGAGEADGGREHPCGATVAGLKAI